MGTRERILEAALELFSRYGYEAVSVSQIGEAVGIRAPSLYKHFASKQEIFDTLLQKANERYTMQASALEFEGSDPGQAAPDFASMSADRLTDTVAGLFSFFLHDSWMYRFRKMLTLEQYRDPALAKLCSELYFEGPLRFQAQLFSRIPGFQKAGDPELLALEFYSPIYLLLTLCDREPGRENQALRRLRAHVESFCSTYCISEEMSL